MSILRMRFINTIASLAAVAALASASAVAAEQAATPANAKVFVAPLTATNCVTFCAVINANGSIARAHAFTTSQHIGTGAYGVSFNTTATAQKNLSKCVWLATPGVGTFGGFQGPTFITTAGLLGSTNGVFVATFNSAGAQVDAPFLLEVSC